MNRKRTRSHKLTLEILEDRCVLSAGFLDPTFDGDGIVTTNVGQIDDMEGAWDVAVYPGSTPSGDAKIIAVGSTHPQANNPYADFALVRYNPDGSLDSAFGTGGKVTTSLTVTDDFARAVALVGDKILAAGSAQDDFALVRYNDNGTLDATFGGKGKGKVVTDISRRSTDRGLAMKVQDNGRMVMGGTSNGNLALVRYLAGGSLDSSFGVGGKVVTNLGATVNSDALKMDLAIYPSTSPNHANQTVVAFAFINSGISGVQIARYTSAGMLDSTFDGDGLVQINPPYVGVGQSMTIQADGRIVVAYSSGTGIALTRLNIDGSLDLSFGSSGTGTVVVDLPANTERVMDVTTDPSGRFLVGGQVLDDAQSAYNLFVARLLPDGSPDATFGNGGIGTSTGLYAKPASGFLALQANGKVVVAGSSADSNFGAGDFTVVRFLGDAALTAPATAHHLVQQTLTVGQVEQLLGEAVTRWQAAGVDVPGLSTIDIRIANLGGTVLGLASGNTIWLDDNAAGWGWFVDATPWDDSEFTTPGNQGEQNRMDLLTVLEHELGHLLGFDHQETGVMEDTLATGRRKTPTGQWIVQDWALLDLVFAGEQNPLRRRFF